MEAEIFSAVGWYMEIGSGSAWETQKKKKEENEKERNA